MNRRRFLAVGAGLVTFHLSTSRTRARAAQGRLRFALIGLNHEHVFRMVKAVRDGGGELALVFAPGAQPDLAAKFFRENPEARQARDEREVLDQKGIALTVIATPPAERAQAGLRAMRTGKDVLADKGGVLSLQELAELRRVQATTRRIYAICYNERLLMPACEKVDELLRAGALGRVTFMSGFGPHGLTHNPREPWFWTRAGRGGIFTDVGTHQADQFLQYLGLPGARVVAAQAGNAENAEHPEFEDWGEMWLQNDRGSGHAMVTYYRTKSAPAFLTLEGTEGKMEVSKSSGRIILTKKDGTRREYQVDPNATCSFGTRLVDDVLARTESALGQAHSFLATELALRAQEAAATSAAARKTSPR